jgi:hypothetical protein
MAQKTKGTELWMLRPDSHGYTVIKIGCPTGITGVGGAKTQIPTTCLDDTEMTFLAGFGQPGQVTVNLDFDQTKISHQQLFAFNELGDTLKWVIGFSDGTAAPTINSAGVESFPSSRTYLAFDGYIADLPFDFAINSVTKSTMQIQRSGSRTLHIKT